MNKHYLDTVWVNHIYFNDLFINRVGNVLLGVPPDCRLYQLSWTLHVTFSQQRFQHFPKYVESWMLSQLSHQYFPVHVEFWMFSQLSHQHFPVHAGWVLNVFPTEFPTFPSASWVLNGFLTENPIFPSEYRVLNVFQLHLQRKSIQKLWRISVYYWTYHDLINERKTIIILHR